VLLIACVNVANLLLAGGGVRAGELALRAAIGAGRGRIVRQLLTETLVLAVAGAALGMGMAWAAVPAFVALSPGGVPRLEQAGVDGVVMAFAVGATILSVLVAGLAPAVRAAATNLRGTLVEGGRTGTGRRDRVRTLLVASEVALALMLLVGAGLLVRSALFLQLVDPGFDTQGMQPVVLGVAVGLASALATSRVLASYVTGVTTTDPLTFTGVVALMIAVALVASAVPAWRAVRTEPTRVLNRA
jgi:putative ABC transport system permease protein